MVRIIMKHIINNDMKLSVENLDKPSNKKFKLIADIALYTLPLYSGAIAVLASSAPVFALWTNFIISLVVITLKAVTKFTAEEPPVVEEEIPVDDGSVTPA
jgi:hypothetical protein